MIVVEHVEICSCGICNCSCWTCIEQVAEFAALVVEFSFFGLAVDGLALNKLWDLPLPLKSLFESKARSVLKKLQGGGMILRYDFMAGAQIVPKNCPFKRKEKREECVLCAHRKAAAVATLPSLCPPRCRQSATATAKLLLPLTPCRRRAAAVAALPPPPPASFCRHRCRTAAALPAAATLPPLYLLPSRCRRAAMLPPLPARCHRCHRHRRHQAAAAALALPTWPARCPLLCTAASLLPPLCQCCHHAAAANTVLQTLLLHCLLPLRCCPAATTTITLPPEPLSPLSR
jgi:hypothetical protein